MRSRTLLAALAVLIAPSLARADARSAPIATTAIAAPARTPAPSQPRPPLFRNLYLASSNVMAHAVVRSGQDDRPARVVIANPAGNTGLGFWTRNLAPGQQGLRADGNLREVTHDGTTGVALTLSGPSRVEIGRVFLDSVRTLRDAEHHEEGARERAVRDAYGVVSRWGKQNDPTTESVRQTLLVRLKEWFEPARVADPARPSAIILERRALGSGARYRAEFIPAAGTSVEDHGGGRVAFVGEGGTRFQVRSFIDRPSLTPQTSIFREGGGGRMGKGLVFLSTKDKLLAGSWQYLTYFGRDTLISGALLSGRASTGFLSTAIGSVLDRVSAQGEIAHEESIGDQAALMNLERLVERVRSEGASLKLTPGDLTALEKPVYDYKMIDGEYLLPQLVARYFARPDATSEPLTDARLASLSRVIARIDRQTAQPSLLSLKPGVDAGNWRDSGTGLGGGRTPLDVNAYLVPSALQALAELAKSSSFPKARLIELSGNDRAAVSRLLDPNVLGARAQAWRKAAAAAFEVKVEAADARARVAACLAKLPAADRAALGAQHLFGSTQTVDDAIAGRAPLLASGVRFSGVALDEARRAIPVLTTDGAFDLFYGSPTRDEVLSQIKTVFQPYPIGLATPVGLVVANAAYSSRPGDLDTFARDKYHGAVVWGWQQGMMRQGIARQLARFKGDAEVEQTLTRALGVLDAAERRAGPIAKSAELWSWRAENGGAIGVVPYGSGRDATEANDRQLWSIVAGMARR